MARWGGLNPALTSWRNGIVARFPRRGTQSDGARADALHGSASQHQPDADGTVDAFDCDVNFLGSSVESGSAAERQFAEALKADFEADPRAQLWIHNREIANADVGSWSERYYGGANAHDKHIHFESKQGRERDGSPWRFPRTDALLNQEEDMDQSTFNARMDAWWLARMSPNAADNPQRSALRVAAWQQSVGNTGVSTHNKLFGDMNDLLKVAAGSVVDVKALAAELIPGVAQELNGQLGLNAEQAELAAERAVRKVLSSISPSV